MTRLQLLKIAETVCGLVQQAGKGSIFRKAVVLIRLSLLAAFFAANAPVARAGDLPGSKDPPFLKRYKASEIIGYRMRNFGQYVMSRQDNFAKTEKVEGPATRVIYLVPPTHTGLEIERNYQSALADAGFTQTFAYDQLDSYWIKAFLPQVVHQLGDPTDTTGLCDTMRYFTAKAAKVGQEISVAVTICETGKDRILTQAETQKNLITKAGEVVVWVDEIAAKPIVVNMVEVRAADIADALATKGNFDLYGIYFDVDKSEIEPQSDKTIGEVATLLKIDKSLKLEIAGHTDGSGDKAHNLKLSQDRASAVVARLETKFGISATRLSAKGYGGKKPVASNQSEEGRAKNRRVELKKL